MLPIRAARYLVLAWLLVWIAPDASADPPVDYLRDVKPIFMQHCASCHGFKMQKGKLRADTAALLLKGGANGPAIVAGKASDSLLIDAIKGANGVTRMPYQQPALTEKQIRLLAAWVDQGAKAPADERRSEERRVGKECRL